MLLVATGTAAGTGSNAVAPASFTKAWGWGVLDGANQLETCTATCQRGIAGGGAGQLFYPGGVGTDGSGHVFVGDYEKARMEEFSSAGAFIEAWGWGVADGKSQPETCTKTCQSGVRGNGAGAVNYPQGIAVDGAGDVFVTDTYEARVDEFSSAGAFIRAWGWGVHDGKAKFEICAAICQYGLNGGGAGQFHNPEGIAVDNAGHVFVGDSNNERVEEFSSTGAFIKAWGWSVADGQSQFETCTTTCVAGLKGGGAGQLNRPYGVAVDGAGDVFVGDYNNNRVDEFSAAGAFIKAWGWGVLDGNSRLETCTTICRAGVPGAGVGGLYGPNGVAVDGAGDVFVSDQRENRVDEFSAAGAFIQAWGWGVLDGQSQFETCTVTCHFGLGGTGAGALYTPLGVAVDSSSDVFAVDAYNPRVDEFRIPSTQPTLTVSLGGTGSGSVSSNPAGIDCGLKCTSVFDAGTQVTLTATPSQGSTFAGWSGGGCSGKGQCTVTMNGAVAITATFGRVSGGNACVVPNVVGKQLHPATHAIRTHHCRVGTKKYVFSTRMGRGRVIAQKPKPHTRLPSGAAVNLVVSRGKRA